VQSLEKDQSSNLSLQALTNLLFPVNMSQLELTEAPW